MVYDAVAENRIPSSAEQASPARAHGAVITALIQTLLTETPGLVYVIFLKGGKGQDNFYFVRGCSLNCPRGLVGSVCFNKQLIMCWGVRAGGGKVGKGSPQGVA